MTPKQNAPASEGTFICFLFVQYMSVSAAAKDKESYYQYPYPVIIEYSAKTVVHKEPPTKNVI